MKISIRWAVILGCLGLVWGTQLLVTPFSFFSTKKVMLRHTRDIMENISDLALEETRNFLSIARGAANLTKRLISSAVIDTNHNGRENLEQYFFEQLEIYPQFSGIYFARPDGSFYFVSRDKENYRTKFIETTETGRKTILIWRDRDMNILGRKLDPQDTYDPRVRPWFKKAVQEKEIIWTEPYVFFTSQKPGITTAGPIYMPNGDLAGVVGVDIELDVLSKFIGKLRVGKTGTAFMINRNRDVIAYPDLEQLRYEKGNEKIRLPKITELSNKSCSLAYDAVKREMGLSSPEPAPGDRSSEAFAAFESRDKKFYTMFTRVEADKISWLIGVYIPEEDYFSEIIANQRLIHILILGLSVLATIAGLVMAGRLIRPISQLDLEAEKIKENDYTSLPRIQSGFRQIQRTADTFCDMKKSIMAYKQELIKKEKINRTIIDTANEAILMVEKKGIISYWNRAAETLFGYSAREVQGKSIFDLVPFQQHRKADHSNLNTLFKKSRAGCENVEINIIHRDGRSIPSELSMVRIEIEETPFLIAVIRDISARKEMEQERMAILEQLQQAQKMEAIGTLAGGIAHDFNNILSSMVGYTELIRESCSLDKRCMAFLDALSMAGDRARDLVRQILTFSFQEPHEFKPLKMQNIVSEACQLITASLPPSIIIHREIDENCGMVSGDATQIHQVALNLMTNAFQAMEETGGTLGVSLRQVNIPENPGQDNLEMEPGTYACYSVSDTGIGINDHVLEKIFDPYFTTKPRGKSTGLGLAVIKGIVHHHGGDIRVKSRPGRGTLFQAFLPVIKNSTDPGSIAGPVKIEKGHENILLVDDQPNVLFVERQILELLGYRVTVRTSAREALETFRTSPESFEVVVTDYSMPEMTGDLLARELVAIRPGLPIILCTGYNEGITRDRVEDHIIREFVMKPVKVKDFAVLIRKVLDK
ncbi:PAS domain S-box protein [Desulfospira joergensenii]|uniref:PAS domain S-box protein n=1 Tax=Desulfospira joergensenii TaxID=53329 RepID=UPI0003B5EF5D|nr:PAS domain S-box protein [Desulfospira joergensenii]